MSRRRSGRPSDPLHSRTLEGERVASARTAAGTSTSTSCRSAHHLRLKLLGAEGRISRLGRRLVQGKYAPIDRSSPTSLRPQPARARTKRTFSATIVGNHFAPRRHDLGDVLEESCRAAEGTSPGGTYLCRRGGLLEKPVARLPPWGMEHRDENCRRRKWAEAEIVTPRWRSHDTTAGTRARRRSVETVVEYLNKNVRNAQAIMREAVRRLATAERACECGTALKSAIFTPPELWPEATTKKLDAIIKRYRKP